ncbi:YncE family protein [Bacillus cereus group sp. MYBK227-2]|uniref:YncE family protein n=1 Tax=Bacillus cereus group sp. MYBK227-2 TaxID=3450653 RepID=UPI003F7A68BB
MADAPKLQSTEKIGESYYKINMGIDNANEALRRSVTAESNSSNAISAANQAVGEATKANELSNNLQKQLDTLVIEGDSSVEAAQARVEKDGTVHETLKEHTDAIHEKISFLSRDIDEQFFNIPTLAKEIKRGVVQTNGWQFDVNQQASLPHNDKYAQTPLTVDCLISIDPNGFDFTQDTNNEKRILFKPDQWFFGINKDLTITADVRNNVTNNWTGGITSKTNLDLALVKEIPLESYGSSQGITTDGIYLYTSNNRLDKNSYHVHKRKIDGTLLNGYILPQGYGHPCGICVVGGFLFVPSNGFPENVIDHKIFVFDTNTMELQREVDVKMNSGGGLSGIAFRKGLFYLPDWQTTGGVTNIYVYTSDFKLIRSFQINTTHVQGIDIAGDRLYAASNNGHKIIEYDLDTGARISEHIFYASVEGEDLCITPTGTILHGDVSIIREYMINKTQGPLPSKEHLERLTLTVTDNVGTKTLSFYRNGVLQGTRTFIGDIKNLNTYGLIINGSFNLGLYKQSGKFKLKGLGIANKELIPTSDITEITNRSLYDLAYVDCSLMTTSLKDIVSNTNLTVSNGIYNDTSVILK